MRGRVENVPTGERIFSVLIDFAHNGVSTEVCAKDSAWFNPHRIIAIFRIGGNQVNCAVTRWERPLEIWRNLQIVTSDNPRTEDVMDIVKDIELVWQRQTVSMW